MMTKKIKMLLIERDLTQDELARLVGTTQSNLANKLTRDNFCEKDLMNIAEAAGVKYEGRFILPDGRTI